eukprot:SAG11_NODE_16629_length_542_cov_0.808126_1_plen_33_part_10
MTSNDIHTRQAGTFDAICEWGMSAVFVIPSRYG